MTSFGKTVLRCMISLKPALAAWAFEVAVFHATGMGGRSKRLPPRAFAAALDFAPQGVGNHLFGSAITAGARGIPQIVSIGCHDLVDLVGWHPVPAHLEGLPGHAHNWLLSELYAHINNPEFGSAALAVVDGRIAAGLLPPSCPPVFTNRIQFRRYPLELPVVSASHACGPTLRTIPNGDLCRIGIEFYLLVKIR